MSSFPTCALPGPKLNLESRLWADGYTTWSDAELDAGQTFEQVIFANVDIAKAVVTIWTPPAIRSRWVPKESKRALDQGKLICTHTADIDPANDLPADFYGEQSAPVDDYAKVLNALVNRGIRPDGRSEADLPDSERIQREATRQWLNGMEASEDLPELRAFAERFDRAPTIRQMVRRRIALLEAKARAHDGLAGNMLERAPAKAQPKTYRNFLDEFDESEPELSAVAADRFAELDPDGFLAFAGERTLTIYTAPRLEAERAIRLRETPPEAAILRLDAGMHTAAIRRIAVSGDGRMLATASHDKTVKLWALPEGRLVRTLRVPVGLRLGGRDGRWRGRAAR